MQEIWKDIKGYEGLYQISNQGRVKSLSRTVHRGGEIPRPFTSKERILKSSISGEGYVGLALQKNGKSRTYTVHRLVAIAFIPNPNNYKIVNHINGDKTDYRIENLEWCTKRDDILHAVRTGLKKRKVDIVGVIAARDATRFGFRQTDIARYFKVKPTLINQIVLHRHYKDVI